MRADFNIDKLGSGDEIKRFIVVDLGQNEILRQTMFKMRETRAGEKSLCLGKFLFGKVDVFGGI